MLKKKIKLLYSLFTFVPIATVGLSGFNIVINNNGNTIQQVNHNVVNNNYNEEVRTQDFTIDTKNLPAKYDPRVSYSWGDPYIRGQSHYQLCWAFSIATSSDRAFQKKKILHDGDAIMQSPWNVNYVVANRGPQADKLGLTYDDVSDTIIENNQGWYVEQAADKLSQWDGPATLKEGMYTFETGLKYGTPSASVNGIIRLDKKDITIENIKKLINKYGAVIATYQLHKVGRDEKYVTVKTGRNEPHASAIIGWDDNVNKNKFSVHDVGIPSQNGALIFQNSWGPEAHDKGYFYASYDSEIDEICAIDWDVYNKNLNQYYYDSKSKSKYEIGIVDSKEFAAVFPTLKTSYNKKEYLKKVAYEIVGNNTEVEIDIYKNIKDLNFGLVKSHKNDPTNGTLVHRERVKAEHPGMYYVDLSKEIELDPNQNYSIVVKILSGEDESQNRNLSIASVKEITSKNDMTFYKTSDNKWENLKYVNDYVAKIRGITETKDVVSDSANQKNIQYANLKFNKHIYNPGSDENVDFDLMMGDKKLALNTDYKIKETKVEVGTKGVEFTSIKDNEIVAGETITLEGIGNYSGQYSTSYPVERGMFPSIKGIGEWNTSTRSVDVSIKSGITKYSQIPLNKNYEWLYPDKTINFNVKEDNYIKYKDLLPEDYFKRTLLSTTVKLNDSSTTPPPVVEPEKPNPTPTPTPTPDPTPDPNPKPDPVPEPEPTPEPTPDDKPKPDEKIDINFASIDFLQSKSFFYNGKAITPEIIVDFKNNPLQETQDYTISYENNTNVGTASLIVSGIGKYTGSKTVIFEIQKAINKIGDIKIVDNKPVSNSTFGNVLFRYSKESTFEDKSKILSKPNSSGVWYIQAYVEGTENYQSIYAKPVSVLVSSSSTEIDLNDVMTMINNNENKSKLDPKVQNIIIASSIAIVAILVVATTAFIAIKFFKKKR